MTATGTEARVCADIAARQLSGIKKYGATVEGNPLPLRAWLHHAYEECLDQAVYLRRAIEQLDGQTAPSPHLARSLDELEVSVRTANCLQYLGLNTVGDLIKKSEGELLKAPNLGKKSLNEVRACLLSMGLTLRPNWVRPRDLEPTP